MENFVQTLVSFPVVPFTVLLGVVLVYWLFVVLGALGIDALDADADGIGDAAGGLIAGGKGGAELIGGAKAGGELIGGSKGAAEGHGEGLIETLGLGGVPVTVAVSFVVFFGWALTLIATQFLSPLLGATIPRVLLGSGILIGASFSSLFITGRAVAPLRKIFVANEAPDRRSAILGRVCQISTSEVDAGFGQATIEDGGAGLILNVFCNKPNQLKKGDRALVVDYDAQRDTYEIEPVDWLLPEEVAELDDPARARAIAASHRVR